MDWTGKRGRAHSGKRVAHIDNGRQQFGGGLSARDRRRRATERHRRFTDSHRQPSGNASGRPRWGLPNRLRSDSQRVHPLTRHPPRDRPRLRPRSHATRGGRRRRDGAVDNGARKARPLRPAWDARARISNRRHVVRDQHSRGGYCNRRDCAGSRHLSQGADPAREKAVVGTLRDRRHGVVCSGRVDGGCG